MLQNSGPYGPNDVPINMGMPVNMTQMSNPMNLGNNLGNLAKMPQPAPQTPSSAYNMPDYSSYAHPPLNTGHSISPFPNYNPLNFQSGYTYPNPNLPHNTTTRNVENNILPMNLNVHSDHGPSLINYHDIQSKKEVNSAYERENFKRKVPINIPQIHTKAFHKHLGMDANYDHYNPVQEKEFYNHELSKTSEKSLLDNNRRKSLENTVKLIENILINNTPKDKLKNVSTESYFHSISTNLDVRNEKLENSMVGNISDEPKTHESFLLKALCKPNPRVMDLISTNTGIKEKSVIKDFSINLTNKMVSPNKLDTKTIQEGNKEGNKLKSNHSSKNNTELSKSLDKNTETQTQSEIHCKPLRRSLINNQIVTEDPRKSGSEIEGSDSEKEELITEVNIKKEIVDDEEVNVKVEPLDDTDIENSQFLKDSNAITRDALDTDAIVIEDNTVAEAKEAATKGTNPKTYFECPHCNLIFEHPKRFLIHTKWHTFGLTNEKRHRLEKENKLRKTMKREARIIERLASKEVKEGAEGDTFPCKDCDKIFSQKSSLKNHRQKYHPTRVRECKICKQHVVGWMALRNHMATHSAGAGFACQECPKRFQHAHSLAKHRDTHLEKTHSCEQCSKKFGSQALLKMHMKCHERTARGATFRCTYCGKGFFESYNLQVHERTHRNERPFSCDICKTSFGTNSSLKRHLKVSHSSAKPFACPICHRSFVSAQTRSRHTARVHGDSSAFPFKCTLCPRQYTANKELQKHIGKVHKEERDRGEVG